MEWGGVIYWNQENEVSCYFPTTKKKANVIQICLFVALSARATDGHRAVLLIHVWLSTNLFTLHGSSSTLCDLPITPLLKFFYFKFNFDLIMFIINICEIYKLLYS